MVFFSFIGIFSILIFAAYSAQGQFNLPLAWVLGLNGESVDSNNNGIIDNSERVGGLLPSDIIASSGSGGGGGGSVTLIGGRNYIPGCPVGYNSAMDGYFQCINGGAGDCFCAGVQSLRGSGEWDRFGQSTLTLWSSTSVDIREARWDDNIGYNRCSVCVQETPKSAASGKRMFATSVGYTGNLGGEAGADQKCQQRADAANLGGTFKAWLLGSENTRIQNKFADTTYINMRGQKVITTFLDYNQNDRAWNNLENSIAFDEFSRQISNNFNVWTGIDASGSRNGFNCNLWTSTQNSQNNVGSYGSINVQNNQWFYLGVGNYICNQRYRLICAEV